MGADCIQSFDVTSKYSWNWWWKHRDSDSHGIFPLQYKACYCNIKCANIDVNSCKIPYELQRAPSREEAFNFDRLQLSINHDAHYTCRISNWGLYARDFPTPISIGRTSHNTCTASDIKHQKSYRNNTKRKLTSWYIETVVIRITKKIRLQFVTEFVRSVFWKIYSQQRRITIDLERTL